MKPMKPLLIAGLAAVLGACARLPAVETGERPADPAAATAPARYVPVTAGLVDYRPVEPASWRDLNQEVGPGARGAR